MPISSYIGNRSRFSGSNWARSFLPTTTATTTTKSKFPRKTRRQAQLKAFIWAHYFTIFLSLSLLLFTFYLFQFGPFSVSTAHHRRHSTTRPKKPNLRRPQISTLNDGVLNPVDVDISTKELYEKIEFLDLDGGPWKQGWVVGYNGNEWDNEKLKIIVVPHSHNDPGWKLTVDEYYDRQSRHILDTIVDSLSKDSRRKFIWEEMSYLERWWRDSSESKREAFSNLVKNGQLEIVGGGWLMNDEVTSFDI